MIDSRQQVAHWVKIFNAWFTFIALMLLVSYFPHWPMPLLSWVNLSFYFLAFLITLFLIKADKYNRDIYVPFAVFFLLYSSYLPTLLGERYIIGSNELAWSIYAYQKLIGSFFFSYSIVYYAARYTLRPKNTWILAVATFALVATAFLAHFRGILTNPSPAFIDGSVYHKFILFHLLPLCAIIGYGLLYPLLKPDHGVYLHSLMVIFTLLSIREVFANLAMTKHLFTFGFDQVFLTLSLIFLNYLFAKKLSFAASATGQVFSEILNNSLEIPNLRIERPEHRKYTKYAAVIEFMYLKKVVFLPFVFMALFFLIYFRIPFTVSLNLMAIAIVLFAGLLFFISSYNSKLKSGGFYITPRIKK